MLIIVSTKAIHDRVSHELTDALSFDHWITVRAIPVTERKISSLLKKHASSAQRGRLLFLVNSKSRKPSDFPGLFVGNWLLSLVFYKNALQLSPWLDAIRNYESERKEKVYVLGMMKPYYLDWANKIYNAFHASASFNGRTSKCLADTTTRAELVRKLGKGCSLVVYVGHGRSRGWSGYRGFRWHHMEVMRQRHPIGVLFHFSCDGLKANGSALPFGEQWVREGRACSSIAACDSLQLKPLEDIAQAFMDSVSVTGVIRIDEILFSMNATIKNLGNAEVERNWRHFRFIGNPMQIVGGVL